MPEYTSIKTDVLKKLEDHLPEIRNRFGIDTIGIFGSVARAEDTSKSDVDVLYTFQEGRGNMHEYAGVTEISGTAVRTGDRFCIIKMAKPAPASFC